MSGTSKMNFLPISMFDRYVLSLEIQHLMFSCTKLPDKNNQNVKSQTPESVELVTFAALALIAIKLQIHTSIRISHRFTFTFCHHGVYFIAVRGHVVTT